MTCLFYLCSSLICQNPVSPGPRVRNSVLQPLSEWQVSCGRRHKFAVCCYIPQENKQLWTYPSSIFIPFSMCVYKHLCVCICKFIYIRAQVFIPTHIYIAEYENSSVSQSCNNKIGRCCWVVRTFLWKRLSAPEVSVCLHSHR